MVVADLKTHYGEPYNNAYFEIRVQMRNAGFYNVQGSVYINADGDMTSVYKAIEGLKKIDWFKKSVRDIRAFKVEDWSNFTEIVKGE